MSTEISKSNEAGLNLGQFPMGFASKALLSTQRLSLKAGSGTNECYSLGKFIG